MYPAILNSQNQGLGTATGKRCGWLCRALKNVGDFLDQIPGLGFYADIFQSASNVVQFAENVFMKTAEYEPTLAEELILDTWVNQKLTPFISKTATELNNALANQNFHIQLAGINLALRRICLLRTYYTNNEIKGLGTQAVALRAALIDEITLPIQELVLNAIGSRTDVYVSSKATVFNALEFVGIITIANSYQCNQYEMQKGESPNGQLPISQELIAGAIKDTVATATGNQNTDTATTIKSDSPIERNLLLFVAAVLVLLGITSKSDKKDK